MWARLRSLRFFCKTNPIMANKPKPRPGDPSSDIAHFRHTALDMFFAPRSVAVIGASEKPRSVGRTILRNLLDTPFGGTVYPIHPSQSQVLGIKAYANVSAVSEPIDLAIIATPAQTAPEMIRECADAGVRGAVIISAGFRESGAEGAALEAQILENARRGGGMPPLRILGPNCLGVMRPVKGLNATFAGSLPRKGGIGFVSQSGALGTAVLDWSIRENFGFSTFVSVGSMLDVGWGELIDYLGADEATQSIVLYMETVGDARAFLSAARQVALDKPIIVLKAGRSEQGARAAERHTGAELENDAVLDAAFRRAGALRVETIADLFHIAEVLAKQPRPKGPRLAILTNAGGPGVLATDALIQYGGALAELSGETIGQLDGFMPLHWSHANPVDLLGDAEPALYAKALEVLSHDTETDGVMVILTPQAMTDPTASAEAIKPFAQMRSKPLLAAWMGGAEVEVGANVLRNAGVPVFAYPDHAVRMFDYLWRYSENLRALYETPAPLEIEVDDSARVRVQEMIARVGKAKRTLLTEKESQEILAAYGIPFVETHLVTTAAQAVKAADALGYPVVMKLNTDQILRKREYDGVILNITSANHVRATFRAVKNTVTNLLGKEKFRGVLLQPMLNVRGGYALHIGSMLDPQFGPVLRFGAEKRPPPTDAHGHPLQTEPTTKLLLDARYRDDALGLPPLNTTLARRMMEHTRVYKILREANVDTQALEQVLARFSQLVVEQPRIKAIEIHPLMVLPPFAGDQGATRVVALDARIVLHDPALADPQLPRPVIRPYPAQYVEPFNLKDGAPVIIRPIRPEDEALLIHFHEKLSEQSVYLRYFHALNFSQRIAHDRLARIATNDYDREIALVVEQVTPSQAGAEPLRQVLAVARLSRIPNTGDAEFAVLIRDDMQKQGLGTTLVTKLIEIGRAEGLERIVGEILPENVGMKRVTEKLGFTLKYDIEEGLTHAVLEL